jgi:hypothetical protein
MRIGHLLGSTLFVASLAPLGAGCSSDSNTTGNASGGGAGDDAGGATGGNAGAGTGGNAAGAGGSGVDSGGITSMCAMCSQPNTLASCPANPGNVNYCMDGSKCCAGAELWDCLCLAETCTYHPCGKL